MGVGCLGGGLWGGEEGRGSRLGVRPFSRFCGFVYVGVGGTGKNQCCYTRSTEGIQALESLVFRHL